MYIFKAKVKDVPEGRNRIRKHIFAADQEAALEKFKLEYEKSENINFNQVVIESIEEVKEAE
jgi:ribosomal protein L20A (L18A)